jgi:hypothetical protein
VGFPGSNLEVEIVLSVARCVSGLNVRLGRTGTLLRKNRLAAQGQNKIARKKEGSNCLWGFQRVGSQIRLYIALSYASSPPQSAVTDLAAVKFSWADSNAADRTV